jgi:hypothetical protein
VEADLQKYLVRCFDDRLPLFFRLLSHLLNPVLGVIRSRQV